MKVFDVRDVSSGVDAALAVVDNPRHRHILKNYRRHALLEVSGLWEDILIPEMTVPQPYYRISERGRTLVLDGMPQVSAFYADITRRGANVFGALDQQIAVSDYGMFIEATFAVVARGTDPVLAGEDVKPDRTYQISHRHAGVWPYRDGRLYGEFIYDDGGSWRVDEVEPESLVSPQHARELLAPYLADSPLQEIVDGLALFDAVAVAAG
jgi:hypothetical protein